MAIVRQSARRPPKQFYHAYRSCRDEHNRGQDSQHALFKGQSEIEISRGTRWAESIVAGMGALEAFICHNQKEEFVQSLFAHELVYIRAMKY